MKLWFRKRRGPIVGSSFVSVNMRWEQLARFKAEVARGIVHTDEWKEEMRREQEAFDNEAREFAEGYVARTR